MIDSEKITVVLTLATDFHATVLPFNFTNRNMFFQMKLYYLHFFFFAPFSMRNPFLPHLFTSIPILTDIKK